MKKIVYICLLLFLFFGIINNVYADDKTYSYYENKKIKKVCKYAANSGISIAKDAKDYYYLYIYDDDTASIGWSGSGCERTNSKGKCADGYKENDKKYPGIMNWSKVQTSEDSNGAEDAYENYSKTNECPGYLAKSTDFASNRFYLSNGVNASSLTNIKNANKKTKGNNKGYYYGIDESDFNLNLESDLKCEYKLTDDSDKKITITFGKNGKIDSKNGDVRLNSKLFSSSYLNLLEDNKCPKSLDACKETETTPLSGSSATNIYMVYGDSSVATTFCEEDKVITFECEGENCSAKSVCQLYSDYYETLSNDLNDYDSASENDKPKMLDQYNDDRAQFNEYCVSVLKTLNYVDGNCVDMCITLSSDLAKLETDHKLKTPYNADSKCNIGESIVSMVYNVLKWAKYIAPVLVIILSMLDFIKAIASQSDDEMKKAQGKFVKRLIVAALLFLLPFIINFVLKTFGFYNSKCDITDLF